MTIPSKPAGSNPEAFWLWPLRPARVGPIIYAGSDFPHPFQFCFSKETMGHAVQNQPRSDLDGLAWVWLNSSGQEASCCAGISGSIFWRDATGPPSVSHFWTRFCSSTDVPDNIVQNQPGSDLVLADCVRFLAKRIRSGSKPVCKKHPVHFWPMLPSRSGPDANQIWHVYWVTTRPMKTEHQEQSLFIYYLYYTNKNWNT